MNKNYQNKKDWEDKNIEKIYNTVWIIKTIKKKSKEKKKKDFTKYN